MLATDMHVEDACDTRARLTCTRNATRGGGRDSVLIKLADERLHRRNYTVSLFTPGR